MRSTAVGPRRFTRNQGHAQARSVDLITAAMYEAFRHAGGQVLAVVVVSTVVVFMAAVGVADSRTGVSRVHREFKNGEKYHAAQLFNCCST